MRNIFIFLLVFFSISFTSLAETPAGTVVDIVQITDTDGIAVASTATVYSNSFPLPRQASFGVLLRIASSGTVDVLVELEQSNIRPTTEGSADTTNYAEAQDVDGDAISAIATITDEVMHVVNFAPVATGFARLKITGQGSNDASTVIAVAQLYYVKGQ